jgi:hypothetical protein
LGLQQSRLWKRQQPGKRDACWHEYGAAKGGLGCAVPNVSVVEMPFLVPNRSGTVPLLDVGVIGSVAGGKVFLCGQSGCREAGLMAEGLAFAQPLEPEYFGEFSRWQR